MRRQASPRACPFWPYTHRASSALSFGRHFGSSCGSQFFVSASNSDSTKESTLSAWAGAGEYPTSPPPIKARSDPARIDRKAPRRSWLEHSTGGWTESCKGGRAIVRRWLLLTAGWRRPTEFVAKLERRTKLKAGRMVNGRLENSLYWYFRPSEVQYIRANHESVGVVSNRQTNCTTTVLF
jgi:hypothetical protein